MTRIEADLRSELRRLVDLLDGGCTMPDGSNADTRRAHSLLGDFEMLPCTLCGDDCNPFDRVVGQASGPRGVILHDGEIAHAACLEAARR